MFYGWGRDSVEFAMPDGRSAVCQYKYLSLLFVFKLAHSQRWYIVDDQPRATLTEGAFEGAEAADGHSSPSTAGPGPGMMEVQRSDLAPLFDPEGAPSLGLWRRFSIAVPVLGLAVLLGLGLSAARGTTSVVALDVGDCFMLEAGAEIDRLTTPDCSEPHDSQIVAIFDAEDAPDTIPDVDAMYWDDVYSKCIGDAETRLIRLADLPDAAFISFLTPTAESWESGEREIVCYLTNGAGLDGSFIITT